MSAILVKSGQHAATWRGMILSMVALCVVALASPAMAVPLDEFFGSYSGSAEIVESDGSARPRDMSVEIAPTERGKFSVAWTSTTYYSDGRVNEKSYHIDFRPTDRAGVYAAAQQRNVFGHEVQLDPMKGEPFVWARIEGDTMTVFSLFVDDSGGYEIQQFDRTLIPGGLFLSFSRVRNGEILKTVEAELTRTN